MSEDEKVAEYNKYKEYANKFGATPGYSDYSNSKDYGWNH